MKRTVLCSLLIAMTLNVMAQKKITQTAGRTQLGEFLPSLNTSTMTSFSARGGAATTSSACATKNTTT